MNVLIKLVLTGLFACGLGGCATAGIGTINSYDERALAQRIEVGATTKSELETTFGAAAVVRFDSGYEVWIYKDEEGAPKFLQFVPVVGLAARMMPNQTRELAVLFGPDGVVRKFRVNRTGEKM